MQMDSGRQSRISNEMKSIQIRSNDGDSTALISTWGARVTSWTCRGQEQLFQCENPDDTSPREHGGIPVLFPQFGNFGPGRTHGVVRDTNWSVEEVTSNRCIVECSSDRQKLLDSSMARFHLKMTITVQPNTLAIDLEAANTSSNSSLTFTAGLHPYLLVLDFKKCLISGLQGTNYLDATSDLEPCIDLSPVLQLGAHMDRVYVDTPGLITLSDTSRILEIEQKGFEDSVVWSPAEREIATQVGLPLDATTQFVCIEPAQIYNPIALSPGATWSARMRLTLL